MNKLIAGIALFSFPIFSYAEITIVSEVLIGQSQHKIDRSASVYGPDKHFSSSSSSSSYGFRIGTKFTENISIELSKHFYGSVDNKFTISYPSQSPGIPGGTSEVIPPNQYEIIPLSMPIDIESIRLGVKGEMELLPNFSFIARLGMAYWEYDKYTPHQYNLYGFFGRESGNDIYYSLGTEYQFSENIYAGIEYSFFEASNSINDKAGDNLGHASSYSHKVEDLSLVLGWMF